MARRITSSEPARVAALQTREISDEMRESYLGYAMSVIVSRALPDVRDGLKPVQRRILYTMHELGLRHTAKTVKSARVVGQVMGHYHPHGDLALYDSLTRMAQPFSLRYPLIIGQGNFGSMDGDPPAAQRYTEAKMSAIAEEMLSDIDKDTVPFQPNYDSSKQEPTVLPTKVPGLLLNGSMGIAVGMATNIPPHNLTEVMAGLRHLLAHPDATTEDLMAFIKGPDFPTGGVIYNRADILAAYGTGKGSLLVRGTAEITERPKRAGEFDIIVSEIPFEVNKANLVTKIAELAEAKKIEGIRDIRDESDKDGLRVVVELKSGSQPQRILNQLFKYTDLEKSFHLNMLALVDGIQPKTLPLDELLKEFLKHRSQVVLRRTRFELQKALDRIHILEGLAIALDHLDAVIKTIRSASDRADAKAGLMKKFKLSDRQAEAILLTRLESLAKLERSAILNELKEKRAFVKELEAILKSPAKLHAVMDQEFRAVSERYGDERRTKLQAGRVAEVTEDELITEKPIVVTLSQSGYVKRVDAASFRVQRRGGKGIANFESKSDEDVLSQVVSCSTHDTLAFLSDTGKLFLVRAYDLPEATRTSRGKPANNFMNLGSQERIATFGALSAGQVGAKFLVLVTAHGVIKRVDLKEILGKTRPGFRILNLKDGDALISAQVSSGSDEIILVSRRGQGIRFSEKQVRVQSRTAQGIRAITLKDGDALAGAGAVHPNDLKSARVLVVTEHGFGKMTPVGAYRMQNRGGKGTKTASLSDKTGAIVGARIVTGETELLLASRAGQTMKTDLGSVSVQGRATQGVRLMKLNGDDAVSSIACA